MHSFVFRANAVLTFGITVLAALCILASLSDSFHSSLPDINLQVLNVDVLQRLSNGNDEAKLTLHISADLRSVFTWNTKQLFVFVAAEYETQKNQLNQVSLWDLIVERKEDAKIDLRRRNKYGFVDQGSNLRGREFNLTMYWNVMPLTGGIFTGSKVITGFRLPSEYTR
ncbi:hypothetical protein Mapa_003910 [Marchantia paleacea]|nr:hypothetical protein Mapa_003910 [Marchantia paleacea]